MKREDRILHLMLDEKFLDYFIEQSETVFLGGSIYWVVVDEGNKNVVKHIKSPLIKKVNWTREKIPLLISEANQFGKIVLHSFFFGHLKYFISQLRTDIKIIWIFWGDDGYRYTMHTKQWYLPLSWEYRKESLSEGTGKIREMARKINDFRLRWKVSKTTKDLIARMNICATWVKNDYEMVRLINPDMQWIYYHYFTIEQMGLNTLKEVPLNFNRIWLGNSATLTNNHLDALSLLKEIAWQGEIITPLSYGDKRYANHIVQYGKRHFGDKFIPLLNFMSLDKYQQYMNSCGIIWMNHIRQQAAGNIIAALFLRKCVILNKSNNLYKTMKEWGISFEDVSIFNTHEKIATKNYLKNKEIIKDRFSKKENLLQIQKLYYCAAF